MGCPSRLLAVLAVAVLPPSGNALVVRCGSPIAWSGLNQSPRQVGHGHAECVRLLQSTTVRAEVVQMKDDEESLYNTDFSLDFKKFDAFTITALLGAAIAFQFFVVANL